MKKYVLVTWPDIHKAKDGWPWQDIGGKSTWTDEFLIG